MSSEPNTEPLTITGQIVITGIVRPLVNATIHVYLEDISYADARATPVVETQVTNVNHRAEETPDSATVVPFAIRLANSTTVIKPSADYSLRVWVDADGDGKTGPGDLFSDQSYPVITHGFGTSAVITLL